MVIGRTISVSATKHIIDFLCTLDEHIRTRRSSAIATAIHLLDTRQVTTLDDYFRTLLRISLSRHIVSLLTTAKDRRHIVSMPMASRSCLIHMHRNMTLRCAVDVVRTEDTALHHCIVVIDHSIIISRCRCAIQCDSRITTHFCSDCRCTHTAAEYIMGDGTASQINRIVLLDATSLSATIDITGNGAAFDVHFIPEGCGIVV